MYKDEEKKLDVRVVEKHIQEGTVTRAQVNTYLKKLPDVSSNIDDEYHFDFFPSHTKSKAGSLPQETEEETATHKEENKG